MRKFLKYIFILLLIVPNIALANVYKTDISYENAKNVVKEVMKDYYIKSPYFQYNSGKDTRGNTPPEEATGQDIKNSVCSAYVYNIYNEAFGMYNDDSLSNTNELFPMYSNTVINLKKYVNNSNLVLYYGTKNTTTTIKFDDFIKRLQPGDIFGYTGHVMIVYDIVDTNNDGKVDDVLMLNSAQSPFIRTRLTGTNRLSHNIFKSGRGNNGFLDVDKEGTFKYFWLSKSSAFFNENKMLSCASDKDECIVIRPYYEENGKTIFNYNIDYNQYKKAELRTKYPGLYIEKTVDKGDNNSVSVGDILTYTIKVTNKSNVTNNPIQYNKAFAVEEEIGNNVIYVSSTGEEIEDKKTITWYTGTLDAGKSRTFTYKVKVNNITTDLVEARGKFYEKSNPNVYIGTGTVSNSVIAKNYNIYYTYSTCYKKSTKTGLNLIDDVYSCVTKDKMLIDFNKFDFKKLISRTYTDGSTSYTHNNSISLSPKDDNHIKIFSSILNSYWNSLVLRSDGQQLYYYLPRWSSITTKYRAKIINPMDFKDGDVLIYYITDSKHTKEEGLYAYIYIDGKFIGKNYSGTTQERNEFTFDYYVSMCNGFQTNNTEYKKKKCLNDKFYEGVYDCSSETQQCTDKISDELKTGILDFINFQTLFDKDYYVILRPRTITNIKFNSKVDTYKLDKDTKRLYGVEIGTDITTIANNFDTTGSIIITNKNDETKSNNFATGDKLKVKFGIDSNNILTYIMSIKGDVNGDGNINAGDYVKVKNHILEKNRLTDVYLDAADYNSDNKVNVGDYVKIKKYILNS